MRLGVYYYTHLQMTWAMIEKSQSNQMIDETIPESCFLPLRQGLAFLSLEMFSLHPLDEARLKPPCRYNQNDRTNNRKF